MEKADFKGKQAEKEIQKPEQQKQDKPELYSKIEESDKYKYSAGYEYLLIEIEKNRGVFDKELILPNGAKAERVFMAMTGRGIRWCMQNGYVGWMHTIRSMKKRMDRDDKIDIEHFALLHTLKSVLLPYRTHPLTFRNCSSNPKDLYDANLNRLNFMYRGNW